LVGYFISTWVWFFFVAFLKNYDKKNDRQKLFNNSNSNIVYEKTLDEKGWLNAQYYSWDSFEGVFGLLVGSAVAQNVSMILGFIFK